MRPKATPITKLKFADLFSGIGGFHLGFERAGMDCTFHSEIVPNRQRLLATHWPTTPQGGDIHHVTGSNLGRPDVMAGGFPCKDTSFGKGHRKGLAGKHGRLYYEYTRVIGEYQRLIDSSNPRWVVIENTPGLLKSNNGRDMAAVVLGLEELGYGWAYRVVDGQHLGIAQRRPRVIIVGHRGGDPGPAWQVLGDGPASTRPHSPHHVGGGTRGQLRSLGSTQKIPGVTFFRKSARPRGKIEPGSPFYETWKVDTFANTLTGNDSGAPTRQTHLILQDGRLRTLTLTEWERLSGFPDNWTAMMPESERFNALGDCFQPTVAEWLGRRLTTTDAALPQIGV